jgi:hypothetical protein
MGYAEPKRASTEHASSNGGAAEYRTSAHDGAPADDVLAASLNRSPRSRSLMQLRAVLDGSPRIQSQLALQRAMNDTAPTQKKPNATGLPDRLKDGVEQLSGLALDDVRVHYNSAKPAAVQAHAYAQGTDIHVAPGQGKHLPHEAWHVVQQKQGRVKPTLQLKGVAINDDGGLEREADAMGVRALAARTIATGEQRVAKPRPAPDTVAQRGAGDSKAKPVGKAEIGYAMKAPVEGIQLAVAVKSEFGKIELVSRTQAKVIDANVRYSIDKTDKTVLWLEHFECHPPGIGLGSLLMFELANVAKESGIKIIKVGSAAPTAVGAYEVFGAEADKKAYDAQFAKQSQKFSDKDDHDRYVAAEATDKANQAVERAQFLKPDSKDDLENLRKTTREKHIAEHSKHDAARVAKLFALASTMIFDPDKLFEKAWTVLERKWDMHV